MTPLEKAQQKMRDMRARGESVERLDPIEKARQNPKSLRKAINGKCWDCQGGNADPGTRARIRDCTATCTLNPVRPYQAKRDAKEALCKALWDDFVKDTTETIWDDLVD